MALAAGSRRAAEMAGGNCVKKTKINCIANQLIKRIMVYRVFVGNIMDWGGFSAGLFVEFHGLQ